MSKAGEQIREDRLEVGVSLRQLAKDIGISASYLSDVEKERRKITRDMATRITAALFKHSKDEGYRDRYDWLLAHAGCEISERWCLKELFELSIVNCSTNKHLYRQRQTIYDALYGELDRVILGAKFGNRYEQY